MTSNSSYTQPPSKVLHLRNLPWECTEEELIEFGKPFGNVVNTKCYVGANRNQAFIEFAEPNHAIGMMSYYASSPEPAQVFSAFGFVHKIATFEKTAGFQALVQFSDLETASSSKDSLDGRTIPRYLIPELGPCSLRITYSAHTDLSVKFQSHRSRDYTNPLLPIAPSAIDASGQSLGIDGKKLEPESNVLASIENMQYAVTLGVMHQMFRQLLLQRKPWKDTAYMIVQASSLLFLTPLSRHKGQQRQEQRLQHPQYSRLEHSTFNLGTATIPSRRPRLSCLQWTTVCFSASSCSASTFSWLEPYDA